jgi:integrase
MPAQKRHKTKYPGVYYIVGKVIGKDKDEKIYYIYYRKNGRIITEKAGRQYKEAMTPAKASNMRSLRVEGKVLSNKEFRIKQKADRDAKNNRWTITRLWDEYKKLNDIKGLYTDDNRFKNYIEGLYGDREPRDLVPLDIDRLRVKLLKKKSPQTVKHVLSLLRRIINFGVDKGFCEGVNFKIKLPEVNNNKTDDLSDAQLKKLLESIDKDTNIQVANIMKLALFTGMRRGELFKQKWKDLDFDRGFIHNKYPKGGPDQVIPMNNSARELLSLHEKTNSLYVFPGKGGGQRVTAYVALRRIRKRAGLSDDFRPLHGLRHVYASMLASSGKVDLYTLQKPLTHKDPRMTQRYAHLRDETLINASNVADDLIQQSTTKKKDKVIGIKK